MSRQIGSQDTGQSSPAQTLRQMIEGYEVSQMVYVAAKLGIADWLQDGPKNADDLAQLVDAHPRHLYRLLRALTHVGIFFEDENSFFDLTPLAAALRGDAPDSVRSAAMMHGEACFWRPWGELLHSVKTGQTAFDHVFGMGFYDYLTQTAEAGAYFNEGMASASRRGVAPILGAYDFSGIGTLVDVGGGQGTFLAAILKSYPAMRGILFDLPQVVEIAKGIMRAEGVAERCELVAGDAMESVPSGGDAYVFKSVIVDRDDDRALKLLTNCRRAIAAQGKLLLVERLIPAASETSEAKQNDIRMMVLTGGTVRTEAEYRGLLEAALFKPRQIVPTQSPQHIIEAVPV